MYIQFAESVIPSGTGTLKNNSALKGSEVQFLLLYIKIESRKQQCPQQCGLNFEKNVQFRGATHFASKAIKSMFFKKIFLH